MKMPMTNSTRLVVAGFGALILAGTLSACGAKDKAATNQAAANAAAPATDNASTDSDQATNMAADMEEHHRQELDHRDMRQGSPMSPAPSDPSPPVDPSSNGQMAPMKDM